MAMKLFADQSDGHWKPVAGSKKTSIFAECDHNRIKGSKA